MSVTVSSPGARRSGSRLVPRPRAEGAGVLPLVIPAPAAPLSPVALGLLRQAEAGLVDAERAADPCHRYVAAHLAALRAGAAVLAVRAQPSRRGRSGRSVWELLTAVAPELSEWAAFFASGSTTRAAAEAGIARLVSERAADDLLRQAGQFLTITRALVGCR